MPLCNGPRNTRGHAVGLGRAAKNGILFRTADSLELFNKIKQVVFDKTGTLTTGAFAIKEFNILDASIDEAEFIELYFLWRNIPTIPSHNRSAVFWKSQPEIKWKKIEEVKGYGLQATDLNGIEYKIGSSSFTEHVGAVIRLVS